MISILKGILFLLTFLYFIIEYKFDEELIIILAILTSIVIVLSSFSFRSKEKNSIELGEKEDFKTSYLFVLFGLVILFIFLYYGVPKINELELFPNLKRESKISVSLLIFLPQIIEFFFSFIFSEMRTKYYATELGLLRSLEAKEEMKWDDFYNFKIIDSHNIIRFQKKNLKYFFIKYDEDYFKEFKEEIVSFLNKKLKNNE